MDFELSYASMANVPEMELLIAESVRHLGKPFYSEQQIEGALRTAWGVDTQLVSDQTYYLVYSNDLLVACGGWSYRKTLFGNDSVIERDDSMIDPKNGAAKIRAFFVKPTYARMGIGSLLMQQCEQDAAKKGYFRLELMATLPGQKLYERHGFIADTPIDYELPDGLTIPFVPMHKEMT